MADHDDRTRTFEKSHESFIPMRARGETKEKILNEFNITITNQIWDSKLEYHNKNPNSYWIDELQNRLDGRNTSLLEMEKEYQNNRLNKALDALRIYLGVRAWNQLAENLGLGDKPVKEEDFDGFNLSDPKGKFAFWEKSKSEPVYDINKLQNRSNFRGGALNHVLEGDVKPNGSVSGYHYKNMPTSNASTIAGTESVSNSQGVYTAQVAGKTGNQGISTFFPKSMTPQQIVDSVNEAYASKQLVSGNTFRGITSAGMRIEMYIDKSGKIISAFPKY